MTSDRSIGLVKEPSMFQNWLKIEVIPRFLPNNDRVATRPGLSGMSRICAMMSHVPARPAPGRQMSQISLWSWLPVLKINE